MNTQGKAILTVISTFAHEFGTSLYELGFADQFRAVERAETREEMVSALSFVNGYAQALRDMSLTVPRHGVTWLRLHHVATLCGLLLAYLNDSEKNEHNFARLIEETKARYLVPLAQASAQTYTCDACHVVHELPMHFGKESDRAEYLARAQWERFQASGQQNSVLAAAHIRTAEAYEALALNAH